MAKDQQRIDYKLSSSIKSCCTLQVSAHPDCGLVVSGYEKVEVKPKVTDDGGRLDEAKGHDNTNKIPSSIGIKLKNSGSLRDASNDWTTTGLEVVGWEPKTK